LVILSAEMLNMHGNCHLSQNYQNVNSSEILPITKCLYSAPNLLHNKLLLQALQYFLSSNCNIKDICPKESSNSAYHFDKIKKENVSILYSQTKQVNMAQ
jgi:hypothetical protein